ncbi:MAG: superinfection immunity protein [Actinomycetota bacterium]|nr:superinfection immunity protein [Actinomycetota bacterium]
MAFPGMTELILMLPAILLYWLPTVVAIARQTDNILAVALVNLVFGWTFVGWIVALIMAIRRSRRSAFLEKG